MVNMDSLTYIQNFFPGYIHHWTYTENRVVVMIVARYESHDKKTYHQFTLKGDDWIEGMPPPPYPLFGLDSLRGSSEAVFICEGEKCAQVLHQFGWQAIAAALGAQSPSRSNWSSLRHFNRFVILRDNDKPGVLFAQTVSCELHRICPSVEVMVANLTPNIPGGDLIDWLQNTILRGQQWDGYSPIPNSMCAVASKALQDEIASKQIDVKECPFVDFKPIEARFDGLPRRFDIILEAVPIFPLGLLPSPIIEFLRLTSDQFSYPPDFAATAFITAMGGLIGRSIRLKMRPGDSWCETTNCWAILVGTPSSKKSPILRRIFTLFQPLEKKAEDEFFSAMQQHKKDSKPCKDSTFEGPMPIRRRYITSDATTPKLRELMAGNSRGIILHNDELKGQFERFNKIGSEGDRSFMMTCWSGLEYYSEDRMCRDSLINIAVALTWIGCIPMNALRQYLRGAIGHGNDADGLMQRFQFVCFPDQKPYVQPTESISEELLAQIQALVVKLDEDALQETRILSFNKEAQLRFEEWMLLHENDLRSGRHPHYWESHLGKQHKALAILTIILHRLSEVITGHSRDQVDLSTLDSAFEFLKYFQAHAYRCYNSMEGCTVEDARVILRLLKEKRLVCRFKASDIYHPGLGGLSDSIKVGKALELLCEYGWLISDKVPGANGRPSEFWVMHPKAFEK